MKKSVVMLIAALALSGALAQGLKVLETKGENGTGAAQRTVWISQPMRRENGSERLRQAKTINLKLTIAQGALGAIDSARLEQALKVESVQAEAGIVVQFKQHQRFNQLEQLSFDVTLPSNTRRGNYPVVVNISNPQSKDSAAVGFEILVR